MRRTRSQWRGPRIALPAAIAAALLVPVALVPAPSSAQTAAPTVTAQPATGVGLDINWTSVPGAAGYQITATDQAGGAAVSDSCFACNHIVIRGLTILHFYDVDVVPVNASGSPIGPAGSAISATYFDLPPLGLSSLSASELPGQQTLRVTWAYNTLGVAAERLALELHMVNGSGALSYVGATTMYRTVDPNQYLIPVMPGRWAIRAVPQNAAGSAPAVVSSHVNVVNSCTAAALCARVSTANARPVRLAAQGFLHGLPSSNNAAVTALEPKQWRIAGRSADTAARSLGGSRSQILSDLWHQATGATNNGYARTPWSNWQAWRDFVRNTVNQARAEGWSPDYWDIWNEPNGTCCPKFSSADLSSVTTARWLQTYEEAWRAIKSADATAKVVGPSTTELQWTDEHWPAPAPEFDLDHFLDYSAEKGLVWDAVSWHESDLQPVAGDLSYSIVNVSRHLERARAVIARHPGTVVNSRIFVNEYGPIESHVLAGWAVGYFRALEDAGVAQANRTCWSEVECRGAGLGGLFTSTGQTTGLYWAHRLYADLNGGSPMSVQSSAPWQFDGLANRDDASQTVRALLGRHWWCNLPVNGWCTHDFGIGPATASVAIEWPYGTGPATVTVARVPAGAGAVAAPVPVSSQPLTPAGGVLTVPVPAVADGDAISIIATPSTTPTTTTPASSTTMPTPSSTTTTTTTSASGAPTLTTVTAAPGPTSGAITLTWAAAQPNGAPVTSYAAACSSPGQPMKTVAANGSTLTATIGGLVWWRSYSCAASATNQYGTSPAVAAVPSSLRPQR